MNIKTISQWRPRNNHYHSEPLHGVAVDDDTGADDTDDNTIMMTTTEILHVQLWTKYCFYYTLWLTRVLASKQSTGTFRRRFYIHFPILFFCFRILEVFAFTFLVFLLCFRHFEACALLALTAILLK